MFFLQATTPQMFTIGSESQITTLAGQSKSNTIMFYQLVLDASPLKVTNAKTEGVER